jgi:hypothetical protein
MNKTNPLDYEQILYWLKDIIVTSYTEWEQFYKENMDSVFNWNTEIESAIYRELDNYDNDDALTILKSDNETIGKLDTPMNTLFFKLQLDVYNELENFITL